MADGDRKNETNSDGNAERRSSEEEKREEPVTETVSPVESPSQNYLVSEQLRTYPSLVSRGILYLIVVILVTAFLFGYFGTIDVVVKGRAVAKTSTPSRRIKSDLTGYVERVYVEEGKQVEEGDRLFAIRSRTSLSHMEKISTLSKEIPYQKQLFQRKLSTAREKLEALKSKHNTEMELQQIQLENLKTEIQTATEQLEKTKRKQELRIRSLILERTNKKETIESLKSEKTHWEKEVQAKKKQVEDIKSLSSKQIVSEHLLQKFKSSYRSAKSSLNSTRKRLEIAGNKLENIQEKIENKRRIFKIETKKSRNRIQNLKNQKKELKKEIELVKQKYRKRKTKTTNRIKKLKLEKMLELHRLKSEKQRHERMIKSFTGRTVKRESGTHYLLTIKSGLNGTIERLAHKSPGAFVNKSELLCSIIPDNSNLHMEITVQNKDIGFIEQDMDIKYKFDAYPYKDHGTRSGTVRKISPSAKQKKGRGYVYRVRGTLKQGYFQIDGERYQLKPGMTAKAEFVTEKKNVLEYLFLRMRK